MTPCLRRLASVGCLLQAALRAEAAGGGGFGLDAVFTFDALAMGALGNEASWGSLAR